VTHVGRSSGRVRRWACGLPYPASGRRSRPPPPVVFPACVLTRAPETRPLPAISCAQSARGDGDSPACRPGADGHCASLIALPPYPLPAVLGAPPPAVSIVHRRRWGPVIGRKWHRVRPAITTSLPLRAPAAEAQAADRSLIACVRLSARVFLHRTALQHPCQLNFALLGSRFYH